MIEGMGFRSIHEIETAANKGDAMAMYNMGYIFYFGKGGVSKDHAKAAKWWKKSAKLGQMNAQNNLANMYYNGKGGLKVNVAAAEYWWGEAADQGHMKARDSLLYLASSGATLVPRATNANTTGYHLQGSLPFSTPSPSKADLAIMAGVGVVLLSAVVWTGSTFL